MSSLCIGSLFSGIGGLELGLEAAGLGPAIWQCENNPFSREVLARHWPEAKIYDDVRTLEPSSLAPVRVLCGGFPCQDVSSAGKRAGLGGSQSGLWYEFARVLEGCRPPWVVVENVASGAKLWVDAVRGDLERIGYATLPVPLSAADVGAPHLRRRIFILGRLPAAAEQQSLWEQSRRFGGEGWAVEAESRTNGAEECVANSEGLGERKSIHEANAIAVGGESWPLPGGGGWWFTEPDVGRVAHGVPSRVDRLRALGNAVVPQCAEVIGWMIRDLEGS